MVGIPVPADEVRLTADRPESRRRALVRKVPELAPGCVITVFENMSEARNPRPARGLLQTVCLLRRERSTVITKSGNAIAEQSYLSRIVPCVV